MLAETEVRAGHNTALIALSDPLTWVSIRVRVEERAMSGKGGRGSAARASCQGRA